MLLLENNPYLRKVPACKNRPKLFACSLFLPHSLLALLFASRCHLATAIRPTLLDLPSPPRSRTHNRRRACTCRRLCIQTHSWCPTFWDHAQMRPRIPPSPPSIFVRQLRCCQFSCVMMRFSNRPQKM